MTEVILGLGSNIDNRLDYAKQAIAALIDKEILKNLKISKIYESKAYLPDDAPPDWDKDYINLAVSGDTDLSPAQLLKSVKQIEQELGRIDRGFWSPREIDIDILIYGNEEIITENLVIPHKYFLERPFALWPANDLKPEWKYPKKGTFYNKTLKEIVSLSKLDNNSCWLTNLNMEKHG